MSYNTIFKMSADQNLRNRVAACVAQETSGDIWEASPESWAQVNSLRWAAAPGWSEAWESALANDVESPGADESVITDGMILATIQPMLAVGS